MPPTTSFRIAKSSVTTLPAAPIIAAWPATDAAPIVRYPVPARQSGLGLPAGAVGRPYCEFGRSKITAAGLDVYQALFDNATIEYANVRCTLYDPRTTGWVVYTGILWRPTVKESAAGVTYVFTEFRAIITELQVSAWT